MSEPTFCVRGVVKRVLSVGPSGGAILVLQATAYNSVRAVIPYDKLVERPYTGEVLKVWGHYRTHVVYGEQLHATAVRVELPTIHELAGLIGNHPSFTQMTVKRARRLVRRNGKGLLVALNTRDVDFMLAAHVELEAAITLVRQWERYWATKRMAELLIKGGLSPTFTNALILLYGDDASGCVLRDPYKLLPFYSWSLVDAFTQKMARAVHSTARRLAAAAESVVMESERAGRRAPSRERLVEAIGNLVGPAHAPEAIDVALAAGRIVSSGVVDNETIHSAGMTAIRNSLIARLSEFSSHASGRRASDAALEGCPVGLQPIDLLILPCCSPQAIAESCPSEARALHVVPSIVQRDSINAKRRGTAVTFSDVLARLPHPTRKSYRPVFVHNCEGLDFLTLAKTLHRLSLGGPLRLCFATHESSSLSRILSLARQVAGTSPQIVTSADLGFQLCKPIDEMRGAAEAILDGTTLPVRAIAPGQDLYAGAGLIKCSALGQCIEETKAAYYSVSSRGTAAIIVMSTTQCRNVNVDFHNEFMNYESGREVRPTLYLRNQESATTGEPIVCRTTIHRLNVIQGSRGKILEVRKAPLMSVSDGSLIELTVLVEFENVGAMLLSNEELKNLSLAYALPLQLALFSEWDHIVVPLYRASSATPAWIRQAVAAATRSILFVGGELPSSFEEIFSVDCTGARLSRSKSTLQPRG